MTSADLTATGNANDAVAFLVELGALALLGTAAWRLGGSTLTSALAALGAVGAAVVLWGLFAAPRATFDLPVAALAVKVLVLGGSAVAGFTVLPVAAACGWALLVAVNTVLLYVGPFAR